MKIEHHEAEHEAAAVVQDRVEQAISVIDIDQARRQEPERRRKLRVLAQRADLLREGRPAGSVASRLIEQLGHEIGSKIDEGAR